MFTVCSTETQFTSTAIGIQLIFRNTVGTVPFHMATENRVNMAYNINTHPRWKQEYWLIPGVVRIWQYGWLLSFLVLDLSLATDSTSLKTLM